MERPKTVPNMGQPCAICGQPANLQQQLDAEREKVQELKETADHFLEESDVYLAQLARCEESAYQRGLQDAGTIVEYWPLEVEDRHALLQRIAKGETL